MVDFRGERGCTNFNIGLERKPERNRMATVFTTVGKGWVVDRLEVGAAGGAAGTIGDQKFIGWGTGAGTAAVGDTTLFTEDSGGAPAYARVSGVVSQPSADTYQVVGSLTANGGKTITNAGLFSDLTVGTLFIKGDFTAIPLLLNDSIEFTISLQVT